MASSNTPYANVTDDEIVETGKRFGYGNWLQPIITANDQTQPRTATPDQDALTHASTRRGRGRPRVLKLRDESAIEKRRAQVREAQRTYQKRKDTATATGKRRVDELLQILSDLSIDVEALLQAASKAGIMYRDDDVSKHVQKLWSSYDTAINSSCVKPELRLLQLKNDQRLAEHHRNHNFRIDATPTISVGEESNARPTDKNSTEFDPTNMRFDLVRFEETTVMQPFQRTTSVNGMMAGRSIFDIVKERQAALKEADKSAHSS